METLIDWLREAREEIIAGLVLALLGWLYKALFKKKEQTDTDIQQVLKDLEEQRRKEAERRAELELELEQKRHEEALRAAGAQKEEARKLEESLQHNQMQIKQLVAKSRAKRPVMSDSKFVELCKSGDAARVEEVIIDGANVNAKDNYGETALMCATCLNNNEKVELLLKHGADVNAKDNFGRTAFIRAMERGKTDTLNLLRKYGARE